MLFLRVELLLLAWMTTVVVAVPFERKVERRWSLPWRTPSSPPSTPLEFSKRFPGADSNPPICDLASAVMPTAPTPLASPAPGLALSHVAVGRGTQNYTCDLSNATATPVAVGAVATLFNVSCIAADLPELLTTLPAIALDLPTPNTTDPDSPINQGMSGHHYFLNTSTPFFNMDTALHSYGTGAFKKANSSDPPADAVAGQFGQGHGSVTWLKLDARDSSGQILQEVYRVNTAGGQPPKQCTGMPAAFEVQYSAEYWIYT